MPRKINAKRIQKRQTVVKKGKRQATKVAKLPRKMLDNCEEMYLRALVNPFDPLVRGRLCYPAFPCKPSAKYTNSATINIAIGTGGVGWLAYDVTPSNNNSAIFYTDASYAGTTSSTVTTVTGSGVNVATWNGQTAGSVFSEGTMGVQFRMVVAGAKFRYTGTELNRGGSVFVVNSPQQSSLIGFGLGNAASPHISRELTVSDQYQTIVLPPMHEEDVEWKDADTIFPWSDGGGASAQPLQLIAFFGTPGNTFVVRLINHYEVAGSGFNMYASMSHVGDPQLVQSITSAASTASYGVPVDSYSTQFVNALKSIGNSPIVQNAASFASRLGMMYAERRFGLAGAVGSYATRMAIEVD